jgi:protoporphyrinogen IX oxidase
MYLWIKALHVLAVISWMAGLLYLPRLFVYHSSAEIGSILSETFKIMERRLFKAIMTPAMIITWATGLWMSSESGFMRENWFQLKFVFVLAMTATHFYFSKLCYVFSSNINTRSSIYYRVWNEIPTIFMIFIVILVIIKPYNIIF